MRNFLSTHSNVISSPKLVTDSNADFLKNGSAVSASKELSPTVPDTPNY